jgi:hypothetical protein
MEFRNSQYFRRLLIKIKLAYVKETSKRKKVRGFNVVTIRTSNGAFQENDNTLIYGTDIQFQ